jgi:hypothetical protein
VWIYRYPPGSRIDKDTLCNGARFAFEPTREIATSRVRIGGNFLKSGHRGVVGQFGDARLRLFVCQRYYYLRSE